MNAVLSESAYLYAEDELDEAGEGGPDLRHLPCQLTVLL